MLEANKIKLGAFLLISVTLLVTALIAAGLNRIFAPRLKAMTIVKTSVEGLAVGAPVKYLGVPVGKVTRMAMRGGDGGVTIYFDILSEALEPDDDQNDPWSFGYDDFSRMLEKHEVSCSINASGLMGGNYLELLMRAPESCSNDAEKIAMPRIPAGVTYIPSNPSHIGNAIGNVSRMLEELKDVNWEELSTKLNGTLDNVNKTLAGADLEATLKRANKISSLLERASARMDVLLSDGNVAKLSQAIDDFSGSMKNIESITADKELGSLVRNTAEFMGTARQIMIAVGGPDHSRIEAGLYRLEETLSRLDNTCSQLSFLARQLSRDPSQLLHGNSEPALTAP